MAHIPQSVLDQSPLIPGLTLRGRGKVRDSYDLPGHDDKILVVASDRISIFDFVLNAQIPQKGEVLTAINHFWNPILSQTFTTDFLASGASIDEYLPEELRNNPTRQARATVVKRYSSPKVEDIGRIILTGSGWKSYEKDGTVCGHKLPPGLKNGSILPYPIYTPTTKAKKGHDEHLNVDAALKDHGAWRERLALQVLLTMAHYAKSRGLLLGDGKGEMIEVTLPDGTTAKVLIDEKGTPDACRYMDLKTYEKLITKGNLAPSLDKEFVRAWGILMGIDKRNPEDYNDLTFVDGIEVPPDVVRTTHLIYRYIFWRLTGMRLEVYQRDKMGIAVTPPRRKIAVVVGSESDLEQAKFGLDYLRCRSVEADISVLSCHRNYDELSKLVDHIVNFDAAIAGAGMAAQLPGVLKAALCARKRMDLPVIGMAFANSGEGMNDAARLSIEGLPEQPVELNSEGKAHFGPNGFFDAVQSALNDEFLPKGFTHKPSKLSFEKISNP